MNRRQIDRREHGWREPHLGLAAVGVVALALCVLAPKEALAQKTGWLANYQAAHRAYKSKRYAEALRGFTRAYPASPTSRKPAIAALAATSAAHLGDLDRYVVWAPRAGKKLSGAARKKLTAVIKKKMTGGTSARPRPRKRRSRKPSPIPVTWVKLRGGTYEMGAAEDDLVHDVKVPSFQMMKAPVTRAQYGACVKTGRCSPARCSSSSSKKGGEVPVGKNHPVVCVDWAQSRAFCRWIGGRLPTEAEWEYAAKSGGKDKKYPLGFCQG